ncbi:antiterminator Q family protein [Pseudomonas fluorescens]|uniref:Antitermination protein Q n=1 Tax=Pseudomonas fluorescens TaxID=294 RepID=A0A5E7EUN4_PSEFL|nr:antiterminator Q family protein [Pseudomonas fluorescens]VVO30588.1 hypothetical protein PS723_04958 [Pseudomonas fluorescens]
MTIRKPLKRALGDTEYLLEQWGWWRMTGMGVPRYVSPLLALMRDNVPSVSASEGFVITDDHALVVDGAVARLTKRNQQMGDFIWYYYGAKWPMLRLAKKHDMSEAKARELVRSGVAWIDGVLEGLSEVA